jgi:hypothetical protein
MLALVLEFNFYFGYRDFWTEEGMLDCAEPHYQHYCSEERAGASGLARTHYHGSFGQGPSDSCSSEQPPGRASVDCTRDVRYHRRVDP